MNTIYKMVSLAALCLMTTAAANAQDNEHAQGKSARELQDKWFTVDTFDMRYQTRVELGKGEYMLVKFKQLSDWTSGNDFLSVFPMIDKVMQAYKDSLGNEQNTQVLDVYIPANQKNIIGRFNQFNESGNMMTINEGGASALKLGMDTLRIIQAKAGNVKLQYTFILKRLANYNTYQQDEHWKRMTADFLDSTVNQYRAKWKHPNAMRHGLNITINPEKNSKSVANSWRLSNNVLIVEGGVGVSLVRNMLCPNYDGGIGVYIAKDRSVNTFARFSSSGFFRFVETSPDKYKAFVTSFLNIELGSESNHANPKSLFYKTSVGFGYKLINKKEEDRDPTMDKQMYRLFLNYSINKLISVTPEAVSNFRKGDRNNSWFGLSLNLHIL